MELCKHQTPHCPDAETCWKEGTLHILKAIQLSSYHFTSLKMWFNCCFLSLHRTQKKMSKARTWKTTYLKVKQAVTFTQPLLPSQWKVVFLNCPLTASRWNGGREGGGGEGELVCLFQTTMLYPKRRITFSATSLYDPQLPTSVQCQGLSNGNLM